jgi:TonB family protein
VLDAPWPPVSPPRPAPAVQASGFSENVQNEPNRRQVSIARPAGFDSAGENAQNEPNRALAGLTAHPAGFESGTAVRDPANKPNRTGTTGGFVPAALPPPAQPRRETAAAQFGDTTTASPKTPANQPPAPQPADSTPVEILYKPRPAYTAEARRLQIEGEVRIEAIFTALGDIQVLRVIEGLGHGLNESAVAAVRSIRFRPARQHGRPVDSAATVRMSFELAY